MALNYMPFLKDPVRKPTGYEPLATFTDRLQSGALNYRGQPIVPDERPIFTGRGPAAMATKVLPFPKAFMSDIPLPYHTTVYNANALHVPDIVTIGEEAAGRAADRKRRLVEDMYVPRGHPGMAQLMQNDMEAAERGLTERAMMLEREGYTPEEIEDNLALERRALTANAIRLNEHTSGLTLRRMQVESAVLGKVGSSPMTQHFVDARLAGLHEAASGLAALRTADAANGGVPILARSGLVLTQGIPSGTPGTILGGEVNMATPGAPPGSTPSDVVAAALERTSAFLRARGLPTASPTPAPSAAEDEGMGATPRRLESEFGESPAAMFTPEGAEAEAIPALVQPHYNMIVRNVDLAMTEKTKTPIPWQKKGILYDMDMLTRALADLPRGERLTRAGFTLIVDSLGPAIAKFADPDFTKAVAAKLQLLENASLTPQIGAGAGAGVAATTGRTRRRTVRYTPPG